MKGQPAASDRASVSRLTGTFHDLRLFALCLLLLFWTIAVSNIERFPIIHQDEPWILAPGYKLFTQGVFGSDLFAGFYGMEQHYLQFMPLMSLLLGFVTHVAGAGLFQLRFVPIFFGVLTVALTWRIARVLKNPKTATISALLLLGWQWLPSGGHALGSGIPLIDIARIARYDILVPALGLCAWLVYLLGRDRFALWIGVLCGLAGLAHLYGLFWIMALSLFLIMDYARFRSRQILQSMARIGLGFLLAWSVWLLFLAMNWSDYEAQVFQNRAYYDVFHLDFYFQNLLTEIQRYHIQTDSAETWLRMGAWLLAVGVPLSLGAWWWPMPRDSAIPLSSTGDNFRSKKNQPASGSLPLFSISILFPLLFAMLINPKPFNYLITIVPLFCLVLAVGFSRLLSTPRRMVQILAAGILVVTLLQGTVGIYQMQLTAGRSVPANEFLVQLRADIPAHHRVLGHPQYWLGFMDDEYRSFLLPFLFADPSATPAPISFHAAMEGIAPEYVIWDSGIAGALAADPLLAYSPTMSSEFWDYMETHHAHVIYQTRDQDGAPISIYELNP